MANVPPLKSIPFFASAHMPLGKEKKYNFENLV
jgi:hypothetical protein